MKRIVIINNHRNMRKSIYKIGAISVTMLSLSLLFKILHWPGANIMLLITLGCLIPLTAFMTASYLSKQEDEEKV